MYGSKKLSRANTLQIVFNFIMFYSFFFWKLFHLNFIKVIMTFCSYIILSFAMLLMRSLIYWIIKRFLLILSFPWQKSYRSWHVNCIWVIDVMFMCIDIFTTWNEFFFLLWKKSIEVSSRYSILQSTKQNLTICEF